MTFEGKTLSDVEKIEKLTFRQKLIVKNLLRKTKKKIKQFRKEAELNVQDRITLEKELLDFNDILEIETDDGELLNEQNIKNISEKELIDTFELAIKEMEKLI